MNDTAIAMENAQRLLDRCPRPPYEYPIGTPERVAHDLVQHIGHIEVDVADVAALESELEDMKDASERVEGLKQSLDEFAGEIEGACAAAEEVDNHATSQQKLQTLIDRVREIGQDMSREVLA